MDLTENSFLDHFHLEDLQNRRHPSNFYAQTHYCVLILRLPIFTKKLHFQSFGFVFTQEKSYIYEQETKKLQELQERFATPHAMLDSITDKLLEAFSAYEERIIYLEESLYEQRMKKDFLEQWLRIKKDMTRLEHMVQKASNTMQEMLMHYSSDEGFLKNGYDDIYEHFERTVASAKLQLLKLDTLYNFYSVRTNEKLNRIIFILAIVSAIFLPLNLIVGFFGMNTQNLPFANTPNATQYVVVIMAIILSITTLSLILFQKKFIK